MSTIDPATTQRIGARLAAEGVDMLDSPVGKTVEHAIAGTSTLMIGGEAAVLERARPILSAMGSDLIHCGPLGMGQAMKLTNNLLATVLITASSEALVAGAKAGLTPRHHDQRAQDHDGLEPAARGRDAQSRAEGRLRAGLHGQAGAQGLPAGAGDEPVARPRRAGRRGDAGALQEAIDAGLANKDVGAVLKLREDASGVKVRLAGA